MMRLREFPLSTFHCHRFSVDLFSDPSEDWERIRNRHGGFDRPPLFAVEFYGLSSVWKACRGVGYSGCTVLSSLSKGPKTLNPLFSLCCSPWAKTIQSPEP